MSVAVRVPERDSVPQKQRRDGRQCWFYSDEDEQRVTVAVLQE